MNNKLKHPIGTKVYSTAHFTCGLITGYNEAPWPSMNNYYTIDDEYYESSESLIESTPESYFREVMEPNGWQDILGSYSLLREAEYAMPEYEILIKKDSLVPNIWVKEHADPCFECTVEFRDDIDAALQHATALKAISEYEKTTNENI